MHTKRKYLVFATFHHRFIHFTENYGKQVEKVEGDELVAWPNKNHVAWPIKDGVAWSNKDRVAWTEKDICYQAGTQVGNLPVVSSKLVQREDSLDEVCMSDVTFSCTVLQCQMLGPDTVSDTSFWKVTLLFKGVLSWIFGISLNSQNIYLCRGKFKNNGPFL